MREELQDKLKEKYPEIFELTDREVDEEDVVIPMDFGIETGDGWYAIIDMLCKRIRKVCKDGDVPVPRAEQIKEKFGGLRFYLGPIHEDVADKIYEMKRLAELMSFRTCESCGTTEDVVVTEGWIKVRCMDCLEEETSTKKFLEFEYDNFEDYVESSTTPAEEVTSSFGLKDEVY